MGFAGAGRGLIRDTPVLIAPSELYAYPGRGGFLVFALDADGNRQPDDGKDVPKDLPTRRRRRKAAGGMGGMMGMMGGGVRKKKARSPQEIAAERQRELDIANRHRKGAIVDDGKAAEEAAAKEEAAEKLENFKEKVEGHRWVAITGVFDHAQLVANYRTALKNPALLIRTMPGLTWSDKPSSRTEAGRAGKRFHRRRTSRSWTIFLRWRRTS